MKKLKNGKKKLKTEKVYKKVKKLFMENQKERQFLSTLPIKSTTKPQGKASRIDQQNPEKDTK